MKKLLLFTVLLTLLTIAPVRAGYYGFPIYGLSGGINTVEQFYPGDERVTIEAITGFEYDVVATAYTSFVGTQANIHLLGIGVENVPYVTRGQLVSSSYDGEKWVIIMNPDQSGCVEVIVHMPWPVTPDEITFGIYPGYGSSAQFNYWHATVRTHQVFLPLILKQ